MSDATKQASTFLFTVRDDLTGTPEEEAALFYAQSRRERRDALEAAKAFCNVCATGQVDLLYDACNWLNSTSDSWRFAMRMVSRLPSIAPDVREAFVAIWVEKAHLPLTVGDRPTLARALRVIFGPADVKESLRLYRGCGARERRSGAYGFSWSTDKSTARMFAEPRQQIPGGGVVLETVAPPEAVLLVREPEDWFDEGEVVVDPFRLGRVKVVERLLPKGEGA